MKSHFNLSWCRSWGQYFKKIGGNLQEQLIKWIATQYEKGNYPEGFKMPSVRLLSAALKLKRHLIERAYRYWIVRGEILYTQDRVGTFMFDPSADTADIDVASSALFPLNEELGVFTAVREQESLNFLTLGSSYLATGVDVLSLNPEKLSRKSIPAKDKERSQLFTDTLKLLRKRKLINNERQFCSIPDGKAISKVLELIANPGDLLVISSFQDTDMLERARQLRLNVAFSGSDHRGMSAVDLEEICQRSVVKVVFVRPEPCFPIPIRMDEARWKQISDLAVRYGFCIVVIDDDYEFRCEKSPRLDFSLGLGNLIYISPYSKIYPILHKTCMVAGPEDFIARLHKLTKRIHIGWNKSTEKALMASISRPLLKMQLRKSHEYCRKSAYNLQFLFKNYLQECALLIYPNCGTFAFLKFIRPLSIELSAKFMEHPLFYEEENLSFEPDQPIYGLRISLFVRDWTALESWMKTIREMTTTLPKMTCYNSG